MLRVSDLSDEIRNRVITALAARYGCSEAAVPAWLELDEADVLDLLDEAEAEANDLRYWPGYPRPQ
ncbi:MAG: hypothetical protein ACFCVE_13390 [Phycisphaerae bacterium]